MNFQTLFLCTLSLAAARAESPHKAGGAPSGPLSLETVTNAVWADNPSIREARARWEAMKQRVPQARAWEDPKVSGRSRTGRFVDAAANSFTDQSLGIEQMIPLSGRNQSRARMAAAEAVGAMEDLRRKEFDAVAKAQSAFFRLVKDDALLDLLEANGRVLHQAVATERAKLESGGQSQANALSAENEAEKNDEAQRDLQRAISDEESRLAILMNRDPFAPLGKPVSTQSKLGVHANSSQLRGLVLVNRPEIRAAEAALTGANAKLELAKREWIPDPAINVEAQRYNDASQAVSEVSAGISFNVPWLNGKKYRAEEAEAAQGVEAALQALEASRLEACALLRDQLQKIETSHHHIDQYTGQILPKARQIAEASRIDYETGKAGLGSWLAAQRSLLEMESMLREHLAEYEVALAELEAIVGADLHYFPSRTETSHRSAK